MISMLDMNVLQSCRYENISVTETTVKSLEFSCHWYHIRMFLDITEVKILIDTLLTRVVEYIVAG